MKHITSLTFTAVILLTLLTVATAQTAHANAGDLTVVNLAETTFTFNSTQLQSMPTTTVTADLTCYGSPVETGNWVGVQLSYLLSQAQLTSGVFSIQFSASDGYKVAIPIDLATNPEVIVAYQLNGQPLLEGLRLVLPGYNGAAWISMITVIAMSPAGVDYPSVATVGLPSGGSAPTTGTTPTSQPATTTPAPTTNLQTTPTPVPPNSAAPSPTASNNTAEHQTKTNVGIESQTPIFLAVALAAVLLGAWGCVVYLRKKRAQ